MTAPPVPLLRHRREWTDEERALLVVYLHKRKMSRAKAAARLGRKVRSIVAEAKRLNQPPLKRAWSAAEDRRLLALRAEGLPNKVISQRIGRSKMAVSCRLHEIEAPKRTDRQPWMASEVSALVRMILAGGTVEAAAARFKRTYRAVKLKVARLRKEGRLPPPQPIPAALEAHYAALVARGINPASASLVLARKAA